MDSASRMTIDTPFVIVHEPTFVARFVLDASEIKVVDNVDAFVDLPDGSSWALTIFTVDEVRRLLQHREAHSPRPPSARQVGLEGAGG
ncbi:hypothetical protein DFJ67_6601 [Asanoa ferruginea]|uniref:Uncharacterized protein n=1 Tax=Asanoa ferruginea TaxID=53367 RepID=A0A3D9ZT33_9ACTN|nr:hypothetical protein [Asanoa ferruginea]REG00547.1 hypothetical protein DFJ67_6601 [Asanoa ferruginea]GIF47710.1 hypothetical protein Afe04nite_22490 [Asanoa ferruginea]